MRSLRLFQRNDTLRDVNAALGGDLKVTFGGVTQEGILVERTSGLTSNPLQACQAFA